MILRCHRHFSFGLVLACGWLMLMGTALRAQVAGQPVSRTFTAIVVGPPVRDVYFSQGEEDVPFMAFPGRRTEEIHYVGDPSFVLYRLVNNSDGTTARVPVGQFYFKGSQNNWLLLITHAANENLNIIGYPEEALSPKVVGTCSFLNLLREPVVGLLGESRFLLQPGELKTTTPSDSDNEKADPVMLALRERESWKKIYSSFWSVKEHQRWLILLYTGDEGEARVLRIRENLPEAS